MGNAALTDPAFATVSGPVDQTGKKSCYMADTLSRLHEMGFFEAVGVGYKNYFRFRGRASREEYWYFWMYFFGLAVLGLTMDITGTEMAHQAVAHIQAMNVPAQINANRNNIPALEDLRSQVILTPIPVFLFFGLAVAVHIVSLTAAFPMLSVHVRRLHDSGRTGWWALLAVLGWLITFGNFVGLLIPTAAQRAAGPSNIMGVFVGLLLLLPVLVFLLLPGSRSYNKFDYDRY